jgi:hypothetical protein
MRKLMPLVTMFVLTLLLLPASGVGQEKKGDGGKGKVNREDATPQDYAYLVQAKEAYGKIVAVDVKAGTMTLSIEFQHWEPNKNNPGKANPNQKILQLQQQIQRDYEQVMRAKNPLQKQQALIRLQQDMQKAQMQAGKGAPDFMQMFHVVKTVKEFDLAVMDAVKVARTQPEAKFDTDTGEIIKYTDEQLKKMKSPDVPGGLTANPADLAAGQAVKIWVGTAKPEPKGKDAGGDAKAAMQNRPQVRMVLILADSTAPEPKSKGDKKDKK